MICIYCDKEVKPEFHVENRTYEIRGDFIEIEDQFYRCPECGAEWSIEDFDSAAACYKIYRNRYNMVQPEELQRFREEKGLTQKDLAKLLRWSEKEVQWIERGCLQSKEKDDELQKLMNGI